MKGLTFPSVMGLILCSLGLTVMVGWLQYSENIVTLLPGAAGMSFNSAFCFFLSGLALILTAFDLQLRRQIKILVGSILVFVATATLSQNFLNYPLGMDQLFVDHSWLQVDNVYPGRMAPNTSIGFIFAGMAFILLPFSNKKTTAVLTQICIFSVLMLGLLALLGYLLNLQALYSWSQGTRMALPSGIGHSILGIGLWSYWSRHSHYQLFYSGKEDKKIQILSALVIVCVLILAAIFSISLIAFEGGISFEAARGKIFLGMVASATIGFILLYIQILPLVRTVKRSEKKLQSINQRLQESENRFRIAFDSAATGMALISTEGHCLKVNPALCQLVGMSEAEMLNMDIRKIIHPDDAKKDLPYIQELFSGKMKRYQSEQRFFHKNGDIIWVMVSTSLAYNTEGKALYFISQIQNISAEKKAEEQLRQMAYHDPLTGLANRNKLEHYIQQLLFSSRRLQTNFALIFLDLDNFKNINDTIGHDAGDLLLQVVSERLKMTVRNTDIVARLGGDEFVLVITHVKKVDSVARIAQQILHNMLKPIVIKGHELYATTSIGISFFPHDGQDMQTLMKNADLALYRAKESGRNNYQFCTPEMTAKAREKMIRQNALNHALVKEEFALFYQPKIDLQTNKISGVEALLRWRNKEYGMVTTEEVIMLAEESGLIIALSEWILKTACRQVKAWQKAGFLPLSVAINLSPRQFKQVNFVQSVLEILNDTNLPPSSLELEVTESLIMHDPTNTLSVLQDLKKAGIKLAIDDFGTGYSSLSYLKRFSVDKLKIDRTFVRLIPHDMTAVSIVTAMIAMSSKLGIKTLAEGVETKEQYEFLLKESCSEMQGYYVSRPLSAEAMTEYLTRSIHGVDLLSPRTGEFESER
jgi:diguanylate cyclase (GGDEF)-like protein/PAS domain S-box-containing protein